MADDNMSEGTLKVALITGGGSGIGAAIARVLASGGWTVVVCGRREEPLRALCAELGEPAAFKVADVTDPDSLAAAVGFATQTFGPVTALVNNAGVMPIRAIADVDVDAWRQAIEVNVIGVLNALAAVLPGMLRRGAGDIVNVGSVGALAILPDRMAYSASKHAVRAITESLRIELAGTIRAIEVNPGATESDLLSSSNKGEAAGAAQKAQGSPLPASEIADAVLFALERPRTSTVSEITIRPSQQTV